MYQQISSIYTKNLITIKETASLSDADSLMNNYNIRHLPVIDDSSTLVGILSKSDFIALKFLDSRLKDFPVKIFMSTPIVVVPKTTTIKKVAQIFIEKKINSVLVANNQEVVGILTSEDLVRLLADDNDFLADRDQLDLSALSEEGWISPTTLI